MDQKLTLHYWPIRARNWWPLIVAAYGNVQMDWVRTPDEDEWYKKTETSTPFGQLPVLIVGDQTLAQSLAIGRYLSRLGHLQGKSDWDIAKNDVLIQQYDDFLTGLGRAHYSGNREVEMNKYFQETLPPVFKRLERMMGDSTTFNGGEILAGDLAIFSALNIFFTLETEVLENFPKLQKLYDQIYSNERVKAIVEDAKIEPYYTRK